MQTLGNSLSGVPRDAAPLARAWQLVSALLIGGGTGLIQIAADGHDEQRIAQLALVCVFALVALVRGDTALPAGRGLRWPLAGFFVLGAVSSLLAFSPSHALLEVSMLLMLLLVALAIATGIRQAGATGVTVVLKVCAAGCALYALKVMIGYAAALSMHIQPDILTFTPGFSNARFLNHAQTVALPLLVLLCLLVNTTVARVGMMTLAAFWWTLLFLTSGRGTFIGLAAGCVAVLVLRRRHAVSFCKMMALTAFCGLVIYALVFALLPSMLGLDTAGTIVGVAQRTASDPTSSRWPLWGRALELIAAHPLLGAGPMHFAHYATDIHSGAHPHNWILQIGAEWGIPALLCVFCALGSAVRALLRAASLIAADDAENHHMLAAWILIGAAVLVDGLVSGLIVMPVSQLWIALYLGCAAGWTMSFGSAGAGTVPRHAHRLCCALLLLVATAGFAFGVGPDLQARARREPLPAKEDAIYNGYYVPRIWFAGYF